MKKQRMLVSLTPTEVSRCNEDFINIMLFPRTTVPMRATRPTADSAFQIVASVYVSHVVDRLRSHSGLRQFGVSPMSFPGRICCLPFLRIFTGASTTSGFHPIRDARRPRCVLRSSTFVHYSLPPRNGQTDNTALLVRPRTDPRTRRKQGEP